MLSTPHTKYRSILSVVIISLTLSGCGIFGSDDVSLNGDLSYEVEGTEGSSVFLSKNSYIGTNAQFETLGGIQIPSTGIASGDLEDGDYDGYQLSASGFSGESSSITLRLLSDGEILGETNTPDENGIYMVEVGEIPDYGDFQ